MYDILTKPTYDHCSQDRNPFHGQVTEIPILYEAVYREVTGNNNVIDTDNEANTPEVEA